MTDHPGRRKLLFQAASNVTWTTAQRSFAIRAALHLPAAQPIPESVWQQLRTYRDRTAAYDHAAAQRVLDDLLDPPSTTEA